MAAHRRMHVAHGTTFARALAAVRRFARADEGSGALEFAFVAMMLTLLIGGILEVAMILFVQSAMEGGIRDASRFGITGFTPAAVSREAQIVDIVNSRLMGLYTITTNDVTTRVYATFSDIGQPEPFIDANGNGAYDGGESFTDVNGNGQWDPDMAASGAGGAGQVVVYQVAVDWRPLTPLLLPFLGAGGTIHLSSAIAVRNEPFGS
jgi:Flp pilus assembly protein TadG